ncbi:MAG: prolipoprotein diacylglyceryl transferase [Ruminococcaceae bacterium]|nr:prolipoprotein diacylglyceryl transferase [Oscillospiraceae bacterium]
MNSPIYFPMFGDNFSIDPAKYFEVFGFKIHWYGVIIATGFILAVVYALWRKKDFGLTEDNIIDMLLFAVPISLIGARLYYVVFNFDNYRNNLGDIVKIWEGGIAIYGAIIFAGITVYIFAKVKKIPAGALCDVGSLGLFIGQAIGRWGNFINREAYGSVTDVFCRMGITLSDGSVTYVHPTFLYESLWNVLGFVLIHIWSKKHRKYDGQVFLMYLGWYGIGRFFVEGLRTDSLYLFNTGIRVSQLVGIVAFIAAAVLLIVFKKKNKSDLYVNKKAEIQQDNIKEAI